MEMHGETRTAPGKAGDAGSKVDRSAGDSYEPPVQESV